jgi:triacylglycerol lipase
MKKRWSLLVAAGALLIGCAGDTSSDDSQGNEDELRGPAAPLFVVPAQPRAARHPFVLVHAFHATSTNSWHFNGVKEALEADGQFVVLADVPPYDGTPERGAKLVDELDRARKEFCAARHADRATDACLAETKVNVVGHSQGGLDARWAITRLGYAPHTASLTTLGTPHRGTPIGDIGLAVLENRIVDVIGAAFMRVIGQTGAAGDLAKDLPLGRGIYWLSERRANDAANDIADADGVYYQSWAGIATLTGARVDAPACEGKMLGGYSSRLELIHDGHFIPLIPAFRRPEHQPNDGHIPVASAKWGNFRGCLPADHLDLVGQPAAQHASISTRTGFDHRAFYRVMAHELAEQGY